jgi:MFS family permease
MARAFRYRNLRLFFAGQVVSLTGTWMQMVAMGWLVYRLTESPFLLGLVGFAGQLPTFLLGPFSGVIADRLSRHKILLATQALSMIQAGILAVLVLTDVVEIWHIISLSIFLGLISAFDTPARQSFVVDMVERKEDIGNAIAINSAIFNGARLVGPSVAGILIAKVGEGPCFLINSISYVAVIAALLEMRFAPKPHPPRRRAFSEFAEGFKYAYGFLPIRAVLMMLGLTSLVGMPYAVLMPAYARDVLHGDSHTMGFLLGFAGAGALAGALFLASRRGLIRLNFIPMAAATFGTGLILLSLSKSQELSMALMMVTGFGMMMQMASSNTFIQTISDEDKRGRVMSFYAMAFMGTMPFGSLIAGAMADSIGTERTIMLGGMACILGALVFARFLPKLSAVVQDTFAAKGIGDAT